MIYNKELHRKQLESETEEVDYEAKSPDGIYFSLNKEGIIELEIAVTEVLVKHGVLNASQPLPTYITKEKSQE